MTDNRDEPGNAARVGRPSRSADPSPAASAAAAQAIRDRGLTQAAVAEQIHVSERQLGRWLNGRERGPAPEQAEALAVLLDRPDLVHLWWPPDRPDRRPRSIGPALAAGGLVVVLVTLVIGFVVMRDDGRPDAPAPEVSSRTPGPAVTSGPVTGVVEGRFAGDRAPAKTIGLWTRPGMTDGCDLDDCPPGTKQAGRVEVGRTIAVSCAVVDGQMLRNGASGEPGYYEDERWLRLAPGQDLGRTDDDLYISNVWFLRDGLPPLPSC